MGRTERKSKRQLIRDERRARKRGRALDTHEEDPADRDAKRQRKNPAARDGENGQDYIPLPDGEDSAHVENRARALDGTEREFFGMLADEEQEYFRHADEMLELNDFASADERDLFLQNVYKEAEGKELKLASSQSCSRLMERLILLSNTSQKKHLFDAFAGHFLSLITHRFASHCCEKLFIHSAPIVTKELGGDVEADVQPGEDGVTMEQLFLLTLDELEQNLLALMSDRYASHTIRVLLIVLSGRPIDEVKTKSLLQSKKKEHVTIQGASALFEECSSQVRAVPSSFTMAVRKILSDTTVSMDARTLRVLAEHPTGNPVLQLLLELESSLNREMKKSKKEDGGAEEKSTLLNKLLPDAPSSFRDSTSQASELVNTLQYHRIGSRLLETIVTHSPGKIFKGLYSEFYAARIASHLRNEVASYPAIRVLNRLSREDLVDAVGKCLPEMPTYVEKQRLNVIRTLFERCHARGAKDQVELLLKALSSACGGDWKYLVSKLCALEEKEREEGPETKGQKYQQDAKPKHVVVSHGCQLMMVLLDLQGSTAKAVQASLLFLKPPRLVQMATSSAPTCQVLVKALSTPSSNAHFHKALVGTLTHHAMELARSPHGHKVLNAVVETRCKGDGIVVPFHVKEAIMAILAEHEHELRELWTGRSVWRAWKADLYGHRPGDWAYWIKTRAQDTRAG